MKMFRRLYWVAEQLDSKGCSKITGVYTSIQDLVQKGLHWCDDSATGSGFRLTMVKPDSFNSPLGVWEAPRFEGLAEALEKFVESSEYSTDECMYLHNELQKFMGADHAKAS